MRNPDLILLIIVLISLPLLLCKKKEKFKGYQTASLDQHNKLRKKHQASPLKLNKEMNKKAIKCAKHYSKIGQIDHSCPHKDIEGKSGKSYGENLYQVGGSKASKSVIAENAADWWYAEYKDYDFKNGKGKSTAEFRHFTQLVWKGTSDLGVGMHKKGSKVYVVSLYGPPGNMKGKYLDNVLQ